MIICIELNEEMPLEKCISNQDSKKRLCRNCSHAFINRDDYRVRNLKSRPNGRILKEENPDAPICVWPKCGAIQRAHGFCLNCMAKMYRSQTLLKINMPSTMTNKEKAMMVRDLINKSNKLNVAPEDYLFSLLYDKLYA